MDIEDMSTDELQDRLFEVGNAIAQERSIGQVTPCWREERDLYKQELKRRD